MIADLCEPVIVSSQPSQRQAGTLQEAAPGVHGRLSGPDADYNAAVQTVYWLLAAAVGSGLALQAGVNTQLRAATGSALWTSILSASLTVVLLAVLQVVQRDALPLSGYARYPWWIWTGGIAGAAYVFGVVALTRHLGVALFFAAVIVGQQGAGLLIDHWGWFGVPVHRLSPERFFGAVLLLAGMVLIRWR
jgi:transporter family-2 protein